MPSLQRAAYGLFFILGVAQAGDLGATPDRPDGTYPLGRTVGWTVRLQPGTAQPSGGYVYTIRKDGADVVARGALDLAGGSARLETRSDQPAMLYVSIAPAGSEPPLEPDEHGLALGAAVAPERLQPSAPRPADFDAFWAGKLKALAKVPMHPVLTPVASNDPEAELFQVRLDSWHSHVQGYLARPRAGAKHPALVIYQWAGVYALDPVWSVTRAKQGWLVFDVDAHDLPPYAAAGVQSDYQKIGDTDRETSYFLAMYLRDTRALDFIQSRHDWDGKTTVVMGGSMGGQQSLATAGLNPHRVSAVLVGEPAGADTNGALHGHKPGYPNWSADKPEVMRTALYFDPVNFAAHIAAPVVAGIGYIDITAPPTGIWTVLDQVKGPAEAVPMIEATHSNWATNAQRPYADRSEAVLSSLLATGRFQPDTSLTKKD